MLIKKHNLIKILSLAGLLVAAPGAYSKNLSPDEALQRAFGQIRHHVPGATSSLNLKYTENEPGSEVPAVYVFSRPGNYFIVSADDNTEALLGYADKAFDAGNIPPSLKWWLTEYARQIAFVSETGAGKRTVLRTQRKAIEPMVSTTWDQDSPYNLKCPVYSGQTAMTGCAATAMAQVMKYFNYPDKGQGTKSYNSNGKIITINFSNYPFDWQNMLDSYKNVNATSAQKEAVANLMYACGASIEMQYSPIESGATDMIIPNALVDNFSYDKGVRYFIRDYYTSAQWEDLVYNQLVTRGPVQYSGQSNEGGHSFVCDGYSSDGYFHFNWGWSGMSDGYYLLSALEPAEQGIGGSLSGFNYAQSVVGEVRKPIANSTAYPELYAIGDFVLPETFRIGNYITVYAQIANYSYNTFTGTVGLKFVNNDDNSVSYARGTNIQLRQGYMIDRFSVTVPFKPSGNFTVSPALLTTSGQWYDIPVKKAFANSYNVIADNGNMTATPNKPGSLHAEDLNVSTQVYLTQDFKMSATVTNPTEENLYATIAPAIVDDNNILAIGEISFVDLKAGASKAIDYLGTLTASSTSWAPAGQTFQLCLINTETNEPISDFIDVVVNNKPMLQILSVSNFSIEGGLANVDAANINFTGTVTCRLGYFGGALDIAIFPSDAEIAVASCSAKPLFISGTQSDKLEARGAIADAEIGKSYIAAVYNGMTQISDPIVFTIGSNSSGVESVVPDDELNIPATTDGSINLGKTIESINIYSLSGALVASATSTDNINISDIQNGIYILEVFPGNNAGRIVKRIVKR